MPEGPITVYFGLGSNVGDRAGNLKSAIKALDSDRVCVTAVSPVYETEHIGPTPEPDYLNAVVRAETSLTPEELLERTQAIQQALGRNLTRRWGPRTIDIDMLLYGGVSVESERLTLPHPRMRGRAFVLRPLADLEPGLVLPTGERISELLARPDIIAQKVWLSNPTTIPDT